MRIWITVSHPQMSVHQTIGDIVRLKTIAKALRDRGAEVSIITWRDANEKVAEEPSAVKTISIKGWVPRAVWATLKDVSYRRLNRSFHRMLLDRKDRPDAIIDYNFYFNDAAIRFGRQTGVPVYLNFEGFIEDSMRDPAKSLLRRMGQHFEIGKYRSVSAILCVSEPLKASLQRAIGGESPPIHVVPNAVELNAVPERKSRKYPKVGFLGGLSSWYAIDQLIRTCDQIRRSGILFDLEIIGDGPERPALGELIRSLDATAWCELAGLVPHDQVHERIAQFDIGVITNHKWWTSPLKLLEYGAAALPVVAPRMESITSLVPEESLTLFEPERYDQMRQCLVELLAKPSLREELGQALHAMVRGKYGTEAMASRLTYILNG